MFFVDVDCGSFFKKRSTVEALRQQFLPEGKSRGIPKKMLTVNTPYLKNHEIMGKLKTFTSECSQQVKTVYPRVLAESL